MKTYLGSILLVLVIYVTGAHGQAAWPLILALSPVNRFIVKASPPAANPVQKAVLLIFPYQADLPQDMLAKEAIREEMSRAADLKVDFYYEYLDLNRFPGEAYQRQLVSLLIAKYRGKPIDLVLLANERTLDFWVQHRSEILPDAPAVVYDILAEPLAAHQLPPDITAVASLIDDTQSLRWIQETLPAVTEIVVVQGISQADREFNTPVEVLQANLGEPLLLTDWSGLPLAEIKRRAAALPANAIIFYQLMFEDAAGFTYRPIDVMRELAAVSAVPVISKYDQFIGLGTIGGYMFSIEHEAGVSAQLGLRILRGEAIQSIPINLIAGQRFIFDHLALQRWDIPLAALPPDSIIKNRQYTAWELYRPQILAGGASIGVLSLLVIFLVGATRRLDRTRLELDQLNASLETQVWERTAALSQANRRLEAEIAERLQAEESVRQKAEEVERFFDSALDLLCIADTDGYFRRLNWEWENTLGYPLAELEGRQFLDFVHPDDLAATLAAVDKLDGQRKILNFTNRYRCRDNSYRWIEWRSVPAGKLIYAAARDITERKRTEEALQASEARYRYLFEAAPIALWAEDFSATKAYLDQLRAGGVTDFEEYFKVHPAEIDHCMGLMRVLEVNQATLELYGAPNKQALLDNLVRTFDPNSKTAVAAALVSLAAGNPTFETELVNYNLNGEPMFLVLRSFIGQETDNPFARIIVAMMDITERKQVEDALRFTQFVVDHMTDAAIWTTEAGDLVYVNQAACRQLGYTREELLALQVTDIIAHYSADQWIDHWQELKRRGSLQFEISHRKKSGEIFPVEVRTNFVRFQGEEYACGIVSDITTRKQAEEALRQSEERFRAIFESAAMGIALLDADGMLLLANPALEWFLGYPVDELRRLGVQGVTHPQDWELDRQLFVELCAGQRRFYSIEKRYIHRDGQLIWGRLTLSAIRDAARKVTHALAMIEDITERKRMEEALRQSEAAFKGYFNMGTVGMAVTSLEKGWIEVNDRLCHMLGYTRQELADLTWADLTHPDDLTADVDLFNQLLAGERETYALDKRFIRKDGQIIHTSLYVACQRNPDRTVHHFLASLVDITERKLVEAEREQLIAELQQALAIVNQLEGILPICSFCKKIRDEDGRWQELEAYIGNHSQAEFSHGFCPECGQKNYPDYFLGLTKD